MSYNNQIYKNIIEGYQTILIAFCQDIWHLEEDKERQMGTQPEGTGIIYSMVAVGEEAKLFKRYNLALQLVKALKGMQIQEDRLQARFMPATINLHRSAPETKSASVQT